MRLNEIEEDYWDSVFDKCRCTIVSGQEEALLSKDPEYAENYMPHIIF